MHKNHAYIYMIIHKHMHTSKLINIPIH